MLPILTGIAGSVYQGNTKPRNYSGRDRLLLLTSARPQAMSPPGVLSDLADNMVYRMPHWNARSWLWLIALVPAVVGCADGPLWRLGYLNPWVVKQWNEEEEILATLSERRGRIESIRATVDQMSPLEADRSIDFLRDTVINEPVLLIRLDAVQILGMLPGPRASEALRGILSDPDAQVRLAAANAFESRAAAETIPAMRSVLEAEDDLDIRLAATRILGRFKDDRAAIDALAIALQDPEPALQFRAMESLQQTTGRDYGFDARKWQAFLNGQLPDEPATSVADAIRSMF